MAEFTVFWAIEVDAENHIEAARLAEAAYMKTTGARVYQVERLEHLRIGEIIDVDLDAEDASEVAR